MDFGWTDTRTLSTADLPGVYANPPIEIEFRNAPDYLFSKMLFAWSKSGENDDTMLIKIAAHLIVSVTNHESERYEMGSVENIKAFIEATSIDALRSIIQGWSAMIAIERLEAKKKSPASVKASAFTIASQNHQKQSSMV